MTRLKKSFIRSVITSFPELSFANSTFFEFEEFVVSGFVVERTSTTFRVSHNMVPLFRTRGLGGMTWALRVRDGELPIAVEVDVAQWVVSLISRWRLANDVRSIPALKRLLERQEMAFKEMAEAYSRPPHSLGQPHMRADYAMALLLDGDEAGARRELVLALALLSYYFGLSEEPTSRIATEAADLAHSFGESALYPKSPADAASMTELLILARDFERSPNGVVSQLHRVVAESKVAFAQS